MFIVKQKGAATTAIAPEASRSGQPPEDSVKRAIFSSEVVTQDCARLRLGVGEDPNESLPFPGPLECNVWKHERSPVQHLMRCRPPISLVLLSVEGLRNLTR